MARTKKKEPVAENERCVSVNVSQIREKRCPRKASTTVSHPDLKTDQRLCASHAKEYNTAIRWAVGWKVTPDESPKEQ